MQPNIQFYIPLFDCLSLASILVNLKQPTEPQGFKLVAELDNRNSRIKKDANSTLVTSYVSQLLTRYKT